MIRYFVFDTNSLISAFLIPGSVSSRAYDEANKNGIVVYSKNTFTEFAGKFLNEKFEKYLTIGQRVKLTKEFEKKAMLVDVLGIVDVCRDSDDNKFLELAVAVGAACIISGDKDLLILSPFEGINVFTPADFLMWLSYD